jgi:hypothetical protein
VSHIFRKMKNHERQAGEMSRPLGTTFADLLGKLTVVRVPASQTRAAPGVRTCLRCFEKGKSPDEQVGTKFAPLHF